MVDWDRITDRYEATLATYGETVAVVGSLSSAPALVSHWDETGEDLAALATGTAQGQLARVSLLTRDLADLGLVAGSTLTRSDGSTWGMVRVERRDHTATVLLVQRRDRVSVASGAAQRRGPT